MHSNKSLLNITHMAYLIFLFVEYLCSLPTFKYDICVHFPLYDNIQKIIILELFVYYIIICEKYLYFYLSFSFSEYDISINLMYSNAILF